MYKRWEPAGNKRNLWHVLTLLKRAKTWQLVLVLILVGFVAATFLRLNNLGMVQKREAVKMADQAGDTQKTQAALVKLQKYVSAHMNTSLGKGVSLPETFKRDYDKALQNASDSHNENSDIYQQASIECRAKFQGGTASFRNDYVACVANAVSALPTAQQKAAALPNPAAYQYNFASPVISFDVAGALVLFCLFLTTVIILRLGMLYYLKWLIRRRSKAY